MRFVINSRTTVEDLEAIIVHEGTHMIQAIEHGYASAYGSPTVDLELDAYKAEDAYFMKAYGRHSPRAIQYLDANGNFSDRIFREKYMTSVGKTPPSGSPADAPVNPYAPAAPAPLPDYVNITHGGDLQITIRY
jgi:hypothetical protein